MPEPGSKGRWAVIIIIAVIATLAAGAYLAYLSNNRNLGFNRQKAPVANARTKLVPIAIDGWIFCMPRSAANTTTDCDLGIQTKDNKNYIMVDNNGVSVSPDPYTTGAQSHVDGLLVQNPYLQKMFVVDGVIEVQ